MSLFSNGIGMSLFSNVFKQFQLLVISGFFFKAVEGLLASNRIFSIIMSFYTVPNPFLSFPDASVLHFLCPRLQPAAVGVSNTPY